MFTIRGMIFHVKQMYYTLNYKRVCKNFPITILNTHETLKRIKDERLSISRFGEGELYLAWGSIDLPFQCANKQIQEELLDVLNSKNSGFMVCLPDVFYGLENYTKASVKFWKPFVGQFANDVLKIVMNKNQIYGNTNCTRFYSGYKDKTDCKAIINEFKEIWNDRDIVCIEGEKTRMGVGNDLFNNAKSFKRILAPAENAYSAKNNILEFVRKSRELFSEKTLFVLALGPTATVLAYDIFRMGYQALDLGHIDIQYEYYLRKADSKIAIPGKYTNENPDGRKPNDDIIDKKYTDSIIYRALV